MRLDCSSWRVLKSSKTPRVLGFEQSERFKAPLKVLWEFFVGIFKGSPLKRLYWRASIGRVFKFPQVSLSLCEVHMLPWPVEAVHVNGLLVCLHAKERTFPKCKVCKRQKVWPWAFLMAMFLSKKFQRVLEYLKSFQMVSEGVPNGCQRIFNWIPKSGSKETSEPLFQRSF